MRPRVFPAEDRVRHRDDAEPARASMRPRVFPAEDSRKRGCRVSGWSSFNEAAGIPRGRRRHFNRDVLKGDPASMRPRVFPAEDADRRRLRRRHRAAASMRPRVFPAEDAINLSYGF